MLVDATRHGSDGASPYRSLALAEPRPSGAAARDLKSKIQDQSELSDFALNSC